MLMSFVWAAISFPPHQYLAIADGIRNVGLTVQVSTKLNRSHLVTGNEALILHAWGELNWIYSVP